MSAIRRALVRVVWGLTFVVGGAYLAVVLIMCLLESRLVFKAVPASERWQDPPDPAIQEVAFPSAGGRTIHGWWLPRDGSDSALLLCHGNYGNVSDRGPSLQRLRDQLGCSVLIFDYPGYGKSDGRPSESGCYASAEAALTWIKSAHGIPPARILLYGESLGGGVAVEMARRHGGRALVLVKTFTSLPAVAKRIYPWLPIHTLMSTRFDNASKVADCRCPVFIASATRDSLVPFALGEELYQAAAEPKAFLALEEQEHGDRLPDGFFDALRQFLVRVKPSPH